MDFNRVILVGRLVAKPEAKSLPSGGVVCNFAIATNRSWKDAKTGVRREEACFVDVAAFDKKATFVTQWFDKGHQILVEGRLKQDRWKTTGGDARSKHSIVADNLRFVESASRHAEGAEDAATETAASDAAPLPAAPAPSVNIERALVAAGVTTEENLPF